MPLTVTEIAAKVQSLRASYSERDGRMADVKAVREGRATEVFGELVTEAFPKPVVANFIDSAARDLAESISPMPALNCVSSNMVTQQAKKFASKKTKIGHYYWQHSELEIHMTTAVDQYLTYGFLPFVVEPDWDAKCPLITLINPLGCYPEFDRFGRTISFAETIEKPLSQWADEFPQHAVALLRPTGFSQFSAPDKSLEVVRFSDKDQMVLYVPKRGNLVLAQVENPLGRCPVHVAVRPGLGPDMRGQFDEVIWVQLARAKMALFAFSAVEKTVNAPIVLPNDVQEFSIGADSVIRTDNPAGVRRVGLEMSPAAFQESQQLQEEMRVGARYSAARSGVAPGSNITGRGIQELSAGFDTQLKVAQITLSHALSRITTLAFEMDEKFWPNESKKIRGVARGARFDETYVPSKDIAGDYTADVTYGFAAGMDPSRALVFLLQLRSDKIITRDFLARQLPFDVDVTQLTEDVDIEELRDALKQGIFGLAASLPTLAPAGLDPLDPIRKIATIIQMVSKGKPIEVAASEAFQPPPRAETTPADETGLQEPPAPGGPGGAQVPALQPGVAPGQASMGPGGQATIQSLMAGMRNGKPTLNASVNRQLPG